MKNQIIAYVSATVIMAVVIAGAGIGIHKGITSYQDKKNARELQAQLEEMSAQQEEPVEWKLRWQARKKRHRSS